MTHLKKITPKFAIKAHNLLQDCLQHLSNRSVLISSLPSYMHNLVLRHPTALMSPSRKLIFMVILETCVYALLDKYIALSLKKLLISGEFHGNN